MKNCDYFKELISSHIDRQITEKELEELNAHMEICKECREEFSLMSAFVSELNGLPEIELPEGFHERSMERLALEVKSAPVSKKRKVIVIKPGVIIGFNTGRIVPAAACVALCILLYSAARSVVYVNQSSASAPAASMENSAALKEVSPAASMVPQAAPAAGAISEPENSGNRDLPQQGIFSYDTASRNSDVKEGGIDNTMKEDIMPSQAVDDVKTSLAMPQAAPSAVEAAQETGTNAVLYAVSINVLNIEEAIYTISSYEIDVKDREITSDSAYLLFTIPVNQYESMKGIIYELGEITSETEESADVSRYQIITIELNLYKPVE